MKKTLLSILFFLTIKLGFCQYAIKWQNTIGGSDYDNLYSVEQTNDGGYILGGKSKSNISGDKTENAFWFGPSYDYWVVKLDSLGNIQWQNTIGGYEDDILYSVKQTSDGGYILGGSSHSMISGDKTEDNINFGATNYWIIKLDAIGNITWQNTIGGANYDILQSISQTSNGGYICIGYSYSGISGDKTDSCRGGHDFWIVRLSSSGVVQWDKTIGGDGYDWFSDISPTVDGGYIVGGYSDSDISGDKTENSIGGTIFGTEPDYWVLKLDYWGNIIWQNTIGGNNEDWLKSIKQTTDGGYILGGYSWSGISGDKTENTRGASDYWLVKLNSSGTILWQKTIGGTCNDDLNSLSLTSDGGFIMSGESCSNKSGEKTENNNGASGDWDLWIVKTDSAGNLQWQKTIGGSNTEASFSCQQTTDDEYIIGAYSQSNISGDKTENTIGVIGAADYWVIKLSNPNQFAGKLFIDQNSNQLLDTNENVLSGIKVSDTTSGIFSFSNTAGAYSVAYFDTGTYYVIPAPINYYIASPAFHSITFSSISQMDSLNDFAFQPAIVANDLAISIVPLSPFRSGLNATYNIHYKNIGTTSLAPTVVFYSDNNLSFVSALPVQSSLTIDSVVWNLPALAPYSEGNIIITVNVNLGLPNGSLIISNAKILSDSIDYNSIDNVDSWALLITGSFDPNAIIVDRDTVSPYEINPTPLYLNYVIYFQNTGNDTAFNIKVENILPFGLDLDSYELVSSSHPVNISCNPQGRLMTYKFYNIQLPDSIANEPLSHGYIHYRIKPIDTLLLGDSIFNYAIIYFDLNAPVQTNYAKTYIQFRNNYFGTTVSGNTSFCFDSVALFSYSTSLIQGNIYNWIVNSGAIISGQGSNSIVVQFLSSGHATVTVQECDSTNIVCDYDSITVNINLSPLTNQSLLICSGDSILLGGGYQTQAGIYYDSLFTTLGCDSVIETVLSINSVYLTQTLSICNGDSILLGGNYQTQNGVYYDSLFTYLGCDSIIETELLINSIFVNQSYLMCSGDSILLGGSYQTQAGIYYDSLFTAFGCDSIIETMLSFDSAYSNQNLSICIGDSIFIGGNYQTQSGVYFDSLFTVYGCDSIIETTLSINPVYIYEDTIIILQGDSVFVGGTWQTQSGVYYDNLITAFGCDSIITTFLNVITSVAEMPANVFTIQPNPVKDLIEMGFTKILKDGIITISNLNGEIIKQIKIAPTLKININVADLAAGVYVISVNGFVQRFIKL